MAPSVAFDKRLLPTRRKRPDPIGVMEGLWALSHALEARSKWMKRVYGVTGPQRLLIRVVGMAPNCSPGDAARRLRLHAGTVTRLAAALEGLGMLRRSKHPRDGRRIRLTLTEQGRRLNHTRAGTVHLAVATTLARAKPGPATVATAFIRKLTAELTPTDKPKPRHRAGARFEQP